VLAAGLGFVVVLVAEPGTAAELPIACVAGTCGGNLGWISKGAATAVTTPNSLIIQQTTDKAVLNWQSFNVGADGKVIFQQPGSSSIALNRIFQNDASKIFGAVEANGQIYLVNQNGFVFGAGAKVKAGSLLVSTLNMSDAVFDAGLAAARGDTPALASDRPDELKAYVLGSDGQPKLGEDGKPLLVKLVVEEGAKISSTGASGRVMLAGQVVDNAGSIETPGGQLVLAAGDKVYLQASSDPALRGLLVEVDGKGEAWNRLSGHLDAARGNITVVGLAVNQQGRISATTTVASNGSVRLLARNGVDPNQAANGTLVATNGGTLELGSQSRIDILPDLTNTATAVDDQKQVASSIEIGGKSVMFRGGTQITAPGGTLTVSAGSKAQFWGAPEAAGEPDPDAKLRVESGVNIDLSGSDVTLPVSRALVEVELRANELKDSPLQRDGVLRGQRVIVDARVGTPLADVSGALAAVPKGIAERTSNGGSVKFNSAGDVVFNSGANVNVSGGTVHYEGGVVQTTRLLGADGKVYDIGTADPNRVYVGLINPTYTTRYDRWGVVEKANGIRTGHYEADYTEGRSAGAVQFTAPNMVLNGSLLGSVEVGEFQRDAGKTPQGGTLIIGSPAATGTNNYVASSINFVTHRPSIIVADGASLPGPRTLELPVDLLTQGGFTRTEIYSNGNVALPTDTPLNLTAGSSLSITANRVDILSDITAASGTIKVTADQTAGVPGLTLSRPGVHVGDGVTLDVRGQWTNDLATQASGVTPRSVVYKDGGTIDLGLTARDVDPLNGGLFDAEVVLGDDVSLRASGGGWMKSDGSVAGGKGGSIALRAGRTDHSGNESDLQVGGNVSLDAFGVHGASGGSFLLQAPRLEVKSGSEWAKSQRLDFSSGAGKPFFQVGSSLFSDFGFSSVSLVATGSAIENGDPAVLAVRAGTTIDARVRSIELLDSARNQASASTLAGISEVILPLDQNRPASTVSMSVTPQKAVKAGLLSVEAGSVMFADPKSTFAFSGVGGIALGGEITAHGGTIKAFVDTPAIDVDTGYQPALRIDVASTARLDVSGVSLLTINDAGIRKGSVLDAGTVSLTANRGSVVVNDGAKVDISGTADAIDFADTSIHPTYTRHTVASAAGALELRAPESIVFLGDLNAAAGVGDTGRAAGGTLSVQLTRARGWSAGEAAFPTGPRVLRITTDPIAVGANLPNGLGLLGMDTISHSGLDSLRLESSVSIELDAGVNINMARQLIVDAPVVALPGGGTVNLSAAFVSFGNSNVLTQFAPSQTAGGGLLNVHGNLIELVGSSSLQRVAKATFDSTGDIPMRGVPLDKEYVGSLNVAGDLTLRAERVYPNTATHFSLIAAGGTNDTVRLEQAATMNAALPLAVAGSVMIQGKQIVQDGTLLAPFGTLDLVASEKLQLTARSITSVSGNGGLFPFGQVQLGEWLYSVNGVPVTQNGVPTRQVTLKSDSIDFQSGATVDLRGGGDLYAYEWVPGTGGSKDALGAGVTPGLYAIVPSLGSEYAPYDPLESAGTGLNVGDSIYLSGVGDLPAGTYALLPARYALLPGAYLVQAVPNSADYAPGQTATLSDGTPVVAGYRTFGDTGIGATRYTGFAIRPGSYGKSLATYDVSLASKFFPARALRLDLDVPRGPADAASLAIVAGSSLNARGNVLTAAAEGGEGASIDVASENLEIVKTIDSTAGTVQISADVLEQWNPAHLLLGGVRASDGETVDVVSSSVVFRNGTQLSLSEVVAAALDEVSVESGASVQSGAAAAGKTVDTSKLTDKIFKLNGDDSKASMLAVSDLSLFDVKREKGGSGTPGKVSVASGSVVGSRGSLMIDAPGGGSLATSGLQGDGAAWQLGSQRIAFGTGAISDGLSIGADLFAHLQKASSVSFVASDTVDFFDSVQLGGTGSSLKQISIQASALQSVGSDIHVTLEASKIALKGATAESADPVAGTNSLHLAASELAIDEGSLSLNGFGTTTIDASTRVRGEGKASLLVAGDLTLNTGVLTTASSANVLLQSDSTVRINSTGAPTSFPVNELGGALTISGKDLLQAGNIVMPSGLVTLQASGQLSVLDGARVDVSGRQVTIGGRSGSSSGGAITLKSGGDLVVANNTALRVNGAGSSDAGDIHVNVGGSASFAGTLEAHAGTGARGGSFDLSAGQLSNFSLLNTSLESGGFNELRSVTTAQGDLVLGAGETITARSVLLEADGGTVHIAGTINALSDAERSKISLFGSNGVSLASTTTLRADGVGDSGRGGEITLGASTGRVSVAAGSLMSAAGKSEAGSIRLRAARDGNDVAIDPLLGRVEGVDAVTIEPVMAFNVSAAPTSGELTAIRDQVKAYINAAADSIRSRLKGANGLNVALEPGIELRSQGDLTLGSLDLSTWRFTTDNTPAALTVRAAGSIKINGIIQDGFDTIPPTGGPNSRLQLRDEKSSTLRFAAGAAFNSANPLALASSNLGSDFTLLTNAVVRTGTGNIDVVASHDIVFAGTGSSIYTGGRPGTGQLTLVLPSTMSFPTLGGQISLVAGHDVLGQALNQQAITAWQVRQRPNLDAAWGIDLRRFGWNVGSLGGGDVSIRAGGNVNDLSATAADSARVVDGKLIQYGGGHMSIESGGDINTSVVHVTKGYNRIEADGGLGSTRVADNSPLGSLLFMQNDANLILDARTGVLLESALNPTRINQPATVQSNARTSYFTYDPAAALNVTTAAGDLSMTYKPVKVKAIMGVTGSEVLDSDVSSLPPNLSLQALSGDVRITGSLNLVQSDFGQLNVFAARDLDLRDAGSLTMSAIPASSTPTPLQVQARGTDFQTQSPHTSSTRHAKDTQPVLITAGRDITGGEIRLPKLAQIFAGRDIVDTNVSSQNLNAGDATSIYASRDLRYTIDRLDGKIEVGGPGRLDVVAGRNVDLGFSRGITTDGRIRNPELATEQGADLTVIAGAGQPIDSSKFLTDIVAESKDYRDMLVAYVERETGLSGLTYDAALTKFQQLDSSDQRPLLLEMFFRELVGAGRDANKDPSSNFKRGYAAIDALFPGSRPEEGSTTPSPYKGDISLTFSRVYTVSGGNISLLAPGGLVNVGLANPPGTLASRPPSLLGIVAQRAGDVRIFANDDVLVNASRIFTLGGGDIAVWSTTGDIDAGRGSKSAVSAPAPVVLIDSSGQVVINFADAVQGSGIRTIAAGDDVEPGDVDLIAPAGIVNAGDAGIGAAGNLNVAASQVVGLDNIQVGGSSTGVPAETSGLGASLSGVSSVATASSAAAGSALDEGTGASQQAAPLADSALGWLDVFVEGFGEEVCKSSDIDCLERNRAKPKP
jgi:filamentous hemagglutinin family protein